MAFFVTPRHFRQRAEFYRQLSQLTAAGMGLLKALEMQQRHPPAASYREPIARMLSMMGQGSTFADALTATGGWMPGFDQAILSAGERSGRLDAVFRLLADYYDDRARMARQIIADLWYPVILIHMVVALYPFIHLFSSGDVPLFLLQTLGILVPLYVLAGLAVYALQAKHGEWWRALVELALRPIPLLGSGRHFMALSRLAAALEALLSAGVTMVEAWMLAASASGSPALRRKVWSWRPQLAAGSTPAELVNATSSFPETFANLYESGEVSGKLDETLRGLHTYYQENGSHKLRLAAKIGPQILYAIAAIIVGYTVIKFYSGYFQAINDASKI